MPKPARSLLRRMISRPDLQPDPLALLLPFPLPCPVDINLASCPVSRLAAPAVSGKRRPSAAENLRSCCKLQCRRSFGGEGFHSSACLPRRYFRPNCGLGTIGAGVSARIAEISQQGHRSGGWRGAESVPTPFPRFDPVAGRVRPIAGDHARSPCSRSKSGSISRFAARPAVARNSRMG